MAGSEKPEDGAAVPSDFTATHWSIVRAAQQTNSEAAQAALEALCRRYWHPLYCYARRKGHDQHGAEDLVQGFIGSLLDHDRHRLKQALQPKGKFRTFLLSALQHFMTDEWRRQEAQSRGGGVTHISLDEMADAEGRYAAEPAIGPTPDEEYDKQYACRVFAEALRALREEYEAKGKADLFLALEPLLTGAVPAGFYEEAASRLHVTPGALKTELNRFKHRLGLLVRREVAQTVAERKDLEEELRYLFGVWAADADGPSRLG